MQIYLLYSQQAENPYVSAAISPLTNCLHSRKMGAVATISWWRLILAAFIHHNHSFVRQGAGMLTRAGQVCAPRVVADPGMEGERRRYPAHHGVWTTRSLVLEEGWVSKGGMA